MTHLRRSLVGLLVLAALAVTATACGSSDPTEESASTTASSAPAEPSATSTTYPLTIEQCGRELTFDAPPETIVVDGEIYATPLFDLGVGDKVTALFSHDSGRIYPVHAIDDEVSAAIKALPDLSSDSGSAYPSTEALIAEEPDLVIEAYNGDAAGGDPSGTDQLVEEGLNVFSLSPSCPDASLEAYFDDVVKLGQILDVNDEATALVDGWQEEIDTAVAEAEAAGSSTPKVFFLDGFDDTGTLYSNTGGFLSDLVSAAGGELVPANETPDDIYTVSEEAVIEANPDIVLTYPTSEEADSADQEKIDRLWELIPDSPAAQAETYTLVPYPDGGGTVQVITLLAGAIADFRAAQG